MSNSAAVPVDQWRIVVNEKVLIYVVHDHAKYEKDEATRRSDYEGWFIGQWISHNNGGWMWNGMAGRITHVAPLPPSSERLGIFMPPAAVWAEMSMMVAVSPCPRQLAPAN